MQFNTRYERQAAVLLSVMWGLAAVLAVAAFAVSVRGPRPAAAQAAPSPRLVAVKSVESVTPSSMLREPRLATSEHKLD